MDLYVVLGLGSGATTADIKRAYRRLARRYHPDINPGDPAAKALYHRICSAYETLVDPARRHAYDATGGREAGRPATPLEFSGFDFSALAQGPQAATFTELFADVLHPEGAGAANEGGRPEPGSDLHATLSIPFDEAMRGAERQVVVTRQETCGACAGAGEIRTTEGRCAACHGSGKVRWARGHMVFMNACSVCRGSGRERSQRCAVCSGHGQHVRTEAIAVRVPPGVHDGARLRIAQKGHVGRRGGRTGDLYVTVEVQPHPLFRRDGHDVHAVVPIGVHEAVLGARIEVPSLDGVIRLRIPPCTQAGQRFRLRDRGAPTASGGRGDLIIEVRIVLPTVVDERSKELMREFGRLYGDVRERLGQL